MAKNCYKCSLPISNEQPFETCKTCNSFLVHNTCIDKLKDGNNTASEQWKCSSCCAKDFAQNLGSSNISSSYVTKLDDILSRITKLQEEQKTIVNSMINACNDTMGNYEETINNVTGMLTSLQSQLDDFTDEQEECTIEDVTAKHQEQHDSSK